MARKRADQSADVEVNGGEDADAAVLDARDQRQVTLIENEQVLAVLVDADRIYLPLRPLCAALGIDQRGQIVRIKADVVLTEGLRRVRLRTGGGLQTLQCLDLEATPLWLAMIEPGRVREDVRDRLIVYKRWVRRKVAEAFMREMGIGAALTPRPSVDVRPIDDALMTLRQVEQFGLAIATLARQHMVFEQGLSEVRDDVAVQRERLDHAARVVGGALRRIMTLEQRLYPGNVISQEQATELKAKVHAVAQELIRHGWSSPKSSGPFQSLFGELNRRFAVPSYQAISIEQFGRAMTWLGEIQAALEAGRPPDLQP